MEMEEESSHGLIQHSEGVSLFGDNYSAERLVFYSDRSVGEGYMKDEFDMI